MKQREEIRALTGIRGVAACMVVLYHFFQDIDIAHPIREFVRHSYVSVDLFFILSGFILSATYGEVFGPAFRARSYFEFLSKRLGRVYPLYIFATALMAMVLAFHAAPPSLGDLIANALLVQSWVVQESNIRGGNILIPAWSLSTELAAYLLFPLLVTVVLRKPVALAWTSAVAAAAVLTYLATRSTVDLGQALSGDDSRIGPLAIWTAPFALWRCLAGFTLGMVSFRLAQSAGAARLFDHGVLTDALLVALIVLWFVPGSDIALVLLFVPVTIGLATSNRSLGSAVLGSHVVHWLGTISYSIYLIHVLVDEVLRAPLRALLEGVHVPHAFSVAQMLLLPIVLGCSALSYKWIEKPGRNWTRRMLAARQSSIVAESSAP